MKRPDVYHEEPGATMPRHKPEYSDMCEVCAPRLLRAKRVSALHRSLVDFGYSTLTLEKVGESYDRAMEPGYVAAPTDDVITRLVRSQLLEAGIVEEGGSR